MGPGPEAWKKATAGAGAGAEGGAGARARSSGRKAKAKVARAGRCGAKGDRGEVKLVVRMGPGAKVWAVTAK